MKKKILLLFVPLLTFSLLWSVHWRRSHPPATAEDLAIENLLCQADRMDVNVQVAGHERIFQVVMAEFRKDDFTPLTRYFRLGHTASDSEKVEMPGLLYFRFFKGEQELVTISNANWNNHVLLEYPASNPASKTPRRLHHTTVLRFQRFLSSRPKLMQEIEARN